VRRIIDQAEAERKSGGDDPNRYYASIRQFIVMVKKMMRQFL